MESFGAEATQQKSELSANKASSIFVCSGDGAGCLTDTTSVARQLFLNHCESEPRGMEKRPMVIVDARSPYAG
jgi:hypothetical protein